MPQNILRAVSPQPIYRIARAILLFIEWFNKPHFSFALMGWSEKNGLATLHFLFVHWKRNMEPNPLRFSSTSSDVL